jgi:hypothetical protein
MVGAGKNLRTDADTDADKVSALANFEGRSALDSKLVEECQQLRMKLCLLK